MNIVERLQEEITHHNELVDRRQAVAQQLAALETEIQNSYGRVQILNELAEDQAPEEDDKSEDDVKPSNEEPSPE